MNIENIRKSIEIYSSLRDYLEENLRKILTDISSKELYNNELDVRYDILTCDFEIYKLDINEKTITIYVITDCCSELNSGYITLPLSSIDFKKIKEF